MLQHLPHRCELELGACNSLTVLTILRVSLLVVG